MTKLAHVTAGRANVRIGAACIALLTFGALGSFSATAAPDGYGEARTGMQEYSEKSKPMARDKDVKALSEVRRIPNLSPPAIKPDPRMEKAKSGEAAARATVDERSDPIPRK